MKPYTVRAVAKHIRNTLSNEDALQDISVVGEVTDYREPKAHLYFGIKDEEATLKCVMWGSRLSSLADLKLENGMKVVVTGNITSYPKGGYYQLDVREIKPAGEGDLHKKFLELKQKLKDEGLFDEDHKKPIPRFVRSVGIISGANTAALNDMLSVLNAGPPVDVLVYAARVQGEGSAEQIIEGLKTFQEVVQVDVILFGRGGGSMEDLWCFNEEALARAVFACSIPTISAVGHEIDQVITDLVADTFAVTPTAGAKIIVNQMEEVIREKEDLQLRLTNSIDFKLKDARQTLDLCDMETIGRTVNSRLAKEAETVGRQKERLCYIMNSKISDGRAILTESHGELRSTFVAGIKERGLVAFCQDGLMVKDISKLKKGSFEATFKNGKAKGEVSEVEVRGSN